MFRSFFKRIILNSFKRKYHHPDSYAMITGCTAGIGRAYAEILSEAGFNLILLARSQRRLDELKSFLLNNKTIQVETILIDFSKDETYKEENIEKLKHKLKDKQISVLINNVGQSLQNLNIEDTSLQSVKHIMNVNIMSNILMTNLFFNVTKPENTSTSNREKTFPTRKALINISSIWGLKPNPSLILYSATKHFITGFSQSIALNQQSRKTNIDTLTLTPLHVATRMCRKTSFFVIKPEQLVISSLWKCGIFTKSYGHWKHCILSNLTTRIT